MPKWDWNSITSYQEAELYLDQQHEKIVVEFEELRRTVKQFHEKRQALADYMQTDAYKHNWDILALRESQPMQLLGKLSRQLARHDGWTVLSTAAHALQQDAPGTVNILKQKYGYKTLKDIMLTTEVFDLCEEPTKKGGRRLLYRIKPEFSLWARDEDEF